MNWIGGQCLVGMRGREMSGLGGQWLFGKHYPVGGEGFAYLAALIAGKLEIFGGEK